jgi:hypothetical protein
LKAVVAVCRCESRWLCKEDRLKESNNVCWAREGSLPLPPSRLSLLHPRLRRHGAARLVARFDGEVWRIRLRIRSVISSVFRRSLPESAKPVKVSSSFIADPAVASGAINTSACRSIDSRVFIMDCGRCATWTDITIPLRVFDVNLSLRRVTGM